MPARKVLAYAYQITIADTELDLLQRKLELTRLPSNLAGEQWAEQNGVTLDMIEDTITYWRDHYSWRDEEARLNRIPQYITSIEVDGFGEISLHFVHSLSSSVNAIPLLFLHGWPGSFQEVRKALPKLNAAGFHVVAPSLPGFGFSSCPNKAGFKHRQDAEVMHKLMSRLHYRDYVVQGGDWGAMIAWTIAHSYPYSTKALHVNLLSFSKPDFDSEPDYTEFEKRSLRQHEHFDTKEFAYYLVQNTKPRTLGLAMHDSPVGMLAWMADKLFTWSDSYPWSSSELITWTLLHYFPGPTGAFQIYRENNATEMMSGADADRFLETPTGVSAFAKEAEMVPRSWAEKKANVVFWQEHNSGGHFAAYEKPEEFVSDLVRFFTSVWKP